MTPMTNDLRLKSIEHKVQKGLIPRDSDIYFLYRMYVNEQAKFADLERTIGRTEESVRGDIPKRPYKKRVRQGSSVRSGESDTETGNMEEGR